MAQGRHTLARNAAVVHELARRAGWRTAARMAAGQVWGAQIYVGLECDLERLPPRREAAVAVAMRPRTCAGFDGFEREQEVAQGTDCLQVEIRRWSCEADIRELFVAEDAEGRAVYCHWLIKPEDQARLHEHSPGSYPVIGEHEALLEGAYAFTAFRGRGAMADGMWQLLAHARDRGIRRAITYVTTDNRASLRGCAAVGFEPTHERCNERRLGFRRSVARPLRESTLEAWRTATSDRGAPAASVQPAPGLRDRAAPAQLLRG